MSTFFKLVCFAILFGKQVNSFSIPRDEGGLWATLDGNQPLLMAHRGEKVIMPEHTIGSYELASIEMADYVEPDLVLTKDGHLVCYHDLTIKTGTDVSNKEEFKDPPYFTESWTGELDGKNKTIENDWFIKDFTLEELQTLKVVQKVDGIRPQLFNELFPIPTFQQYLNIVHKMSYKQNRTIGVIPELKQPKFHNTDREAYFMEKELLRILSENGYPTKAGEVENCKYVNESGDPIHSIPCAHVLIQSFDIDALEYLTTVSNIDLLMLADVEYLEHLTYKGLERVAKFAKHFSIWKELMYTGVEAELEAENIEYDKNAIEDLGGFIPPKEITKEAHRLNLKMGLFTIYDSHEKSHRGCTIQCDLPEDKEKELFYYFDMGVDGLFVENVQEAIQLRMKYNHKLQMDAVVRSSAGHLVPIKLSALLLLFLTLSKGFNL